MKYETYTSHAFIIFIKAESKHITKLSMSEFKHTRYLMHVNYFMICSFVLSYWIDVYIHFLQISNTIVFIKKCNTFWIFDEIEIGLFILITIFIKRQRNLKI